MSTVSPPEDPVDPQIRNFVTFLSERSGAYPAADNLTLNERRWIAEKVRQPLVTGGPVLEAHCDYQVLIKDYCILVRAINTTPGQYKPALIYLHGGGWMLFSVNTHDRVMREIAFRTGAAVIGIEPVSRIAFSKAARRNQSRIGLAAGEGLRDWGGHQQAGNWG
jgi:acetyl esterase